VVVLFHQLLLDLHVVLGVATSNESAGQPFVGLPL
jgi:hypothetical protein